MCQPTGSCLLTTMFGSLLQLVPTGPFKSRIKHAMQLQPFDNPTDCNRKSGCNRLQRSLFAVHLTGLANSIHGPPNASTATPPSSSVSVHNPSTQEMAVGVLHDMGSKSILKKVKENEGSSQASSRATPLAPQRYLPLSLPQPHRSPPLSLPCPIPPPRWRHARYIPGVFTHDVGQRAFLKTVKGNTSNLTNLTSHRGRL